MRAERTKAKQATQSDGRIAQLIPPLPFLERLADGGEYRTHQAAEKSIAAVWALVFLIVWPPWYVLVWCVATAGYVVSILSSVSPSALLHLLEQQNKRLWTGFCPARHRRKEPMDEERSAAILDTVFKRKSVELFFATVLWAALWWWCFFSII